jgi:hypothetical protein
MTIIYPPATISYLPAKDQLTFKLRRIKGKPTLSSGKLSLWADQEGNIVGIAVDSYFQKLREFGKEPRNIKLEGIWEGVEISDKDISEARQELLKKLEEKF